MSVTHFFFSGCVYGGAEHTEGSSWFADSTPCMTCMCVDGVTTCSEVHCLSPCVNFISVPGECCPMCAGKHIHLTFTFNLKYMCSYSFIVTICRYFFEQTVYLRAKYMDQGTVSIQPMTPVRSAHVRYETNKNDLCVWS